MDHASGILPRGWLLPHLGALGAHPELKRDHFQTSSASFGLPQTPTERLIDV